jgi:hypothetical protein
MNTQMVATTTRAAATTRAERVRTMILSWAGSSLAQAVSGQPFLVALAIILQRGANA